MDKRVYFRSVWLPFVLLAPQIAITLIFFFWPAFQTLYQSLLVEDAFGGSVEFVGLQNFRELFHDDDYLASFRVTAVFSVLVTVLGLSISLVLAVLADRVVRGAQAYKTLLIWPYAVAPAVAASGWASTASLRSGRSLSSDRLLQASVALCRGMSRRPSPSSR